MNRIRLLFVGRGLAAAGLIALASNSAAAVNAGPPAFVAAEEPPGGKLLRSPRPNSGHYLVILKEAKGEDGIVQTLAPEAVDSAALRLSASYGGNVEMQYSNVLRGFATAMTDEEAEAMSLDPEVAFVEEDSIMEAAQDAEAEATQGSPPSWGLDRIDQRYLPLDNAYRYGGTGAGVNVYVVDTGIWFWHNEFGGRAESLYDFQLDRSSIGFDCNGHGTHVAATIGGAWVGVAKSVRLFAVRVLGSGGFGCDGAGEVRWIVKGLEKVLGYDLSSHAGEPSVVNISIGGPASPSFDLAVRNLVAAGLTVVVAAGNNGWDASAFSPSRVAEAITVGASDILDQKPEFSNYGSVVDLFAPGVHISSAWCCGTNLYNYLDGTSMAAPHVAGAAARYQGRNRSAPPREVRDWLVANATPVVSGVPAGTTTGLLFLPPPPPAPYGLHAQHTCGNEIRLTWSFAGAADGFLIERRAGGTWAQIASAGIGDRQYYDRGVSAGNSYTYRIRAFNGAGTSDYSAEAGATVVPLSLDDVKVSPSSVVQGRTQTVSWSAREQARYTLYLYTDDGVPVDTTLLLPGGGPDGLIAAAGPSSATTHLWTVPRNLAARDYRVKVALQDACGHGVSALSLPFTVVTRNAVSLTAGASTVGEGSGSVAVVARLTTDDGTASSFPASVQLATASLTASASSNACASGDYLPASANLTFPAGSPSGATRTAMVGVCPDALDEYDETFEATLSAPVGALLVAPSSTVITIADDDPLPRLRVGDARLVEPITGQTSIAVEVSLSEPSGRDVGVNFTSVAVTATAGDDYLARTGTVSFTPGTTSRVVTFTVLSDNLVEPDETFLVRIAQPHNALVEDGEGVVTIVDPPYVSIGDASVVEGNSGSALLVFPVTLSKPGSASIEVPWSTVALEGGADPGTDYVTSSGTLHFSPGSVLAQVTVEVRGDTLFEYDQPLGVHLEQPANAALLDPDARGFILNDDLPPPVGIQGASVSEGNSTTLAVFTVSMLGPTERGFMVRWQTADGTAAAGSDYLAGSGIIKFDVRPGVPERPGDPEVSVTVIGDAQVEPDETFFVRLLGLTAQPGVVLAEATGVIRNDDAPPRILVSVSDAVVDDGEIGETTQLVFFVRILGTATGPVSVGWSTVSGGTATPGVDYVPASGTLSLPVGTTTATFGVTVIGDHIPREPEETVFVELRSPVGAELFDAQGVGTIRAEERGGVHTMANGALP